MFINVYSTSAFKGITSFLAVISDVSMSVARSNSFLLG